MSLLPLLIQFNRNNIFWYWCPLNQLGHRKERGKDSCLQKGKESCKCCDVKGREGIANSKADRNKTTLIAALICNIRRHRVCYKALLWSSGDCIKLFYPLQLYNNCTLMMLFNERFRDILSWCIKAKNTKLKIKTKVCDKVWLFWKIRRGSFECYLSLICILVQHSLAE